MNHEKLFTEEQCARRVQNGLTTVDLPSSEQAVAAIKQHATKRLSSAITFGRIPTLKDRWGFGSIDRVGEPVVFKGVLYEHEFSPHVASALQGRILRHIDSAEGVIEFGNSDVVSSFIKAPVHIQVSDVVMASPLYVREARTAIIPAQLDPIDMLVAISHAHIALAARSRYELDRKGKPREVTRGLAHWSEWSGSLLGDSLSQDLTRTQTVDLTKAIIEDGVSIYASELVTSLDERRAHVDAEWERILHEAHPNIIDALSGFRARYVGDFRTDMAILMNRTSDNTLRLDTNTIIGYAVARQYQRVFGLQVLDEKGELTGDSEPNRMVMRQRAQATGAAVLDAARIVGDAQKTQSRLMRAVGAIGNTHNRVMQNALQTADQNQQATIENASVLHDFLLFEDEQLALLEERTVIEVVNENRLDTDSFRQDVIDNLVYGEDFGFLPLQAIVPFLTGQFRFVQMIQNIFNASPYARFINAQPEDRGSESIVSLYTHVLSEMQRALRRMKGYDSDELFKALEHGVWNARGALRSAMKSSKYYGRENKRVFRVYEIVDFVFSSFYERMIVPTQDPSWDDEYLREIPDSIRGELNDFARRSGHSSSDYSVLVGFAYGYAQTVAQELHGALSADAALIKSQLITEARRWNLEIEFVQELLELARCQGERVKLEQQSHHG